MSWVVIVVAGPIRFDRGVILYLGVFANQHTLFARSFYTQSFGLQTCVADDSAGNTATNHNKYS